MDEPELRDEMVGHALWVRAQAEAHHHWFAGCLPMIASENLISPLAREMLVTDLHDRYAEGHPGKRYYQGCTYIDLIETRCEELAKRLFQSQYVDVRPISGTVANLGVLFALAKPGEKISTAKVAAGAHISSADFGAVGVRGLQRVEYPFNVEDMTIDVDGAAKVIREEKPKVALFGQSVFLFPAPIKELQPALEEAGSAVVYDAAHVLGLIAGGEFQDPLREGAHVITGSTHKTLPGPQHGIVVANPRDDKMRRKLDSGIFPGVVSNHHLHAVAALAVSLAEHLAFGRSYASQIVRNARRLAEQLHAKGITVLAEKRGFTRSHTIVVDVRAHGGGKRVVEDLERANIIANKNLLPWDASDKAMDPSGVRFGTQELTRIGMTESEMDHVADIIAKVIVGRKDAASIRAEIAELRCQFNTIHYCFTPGVEAHKYNALLPTPVPLG